MSTANETVIENKTDSKTRRPDLDEETIGKHMMTYGGTLMASSLPAIYTLSSPNAGVSKALPLLTLGGGYTIAAYGKKLLENNEEESGINEVNKLLDGSEDAKVRIKGSEDYTRPVEDTEEIREFIHNLEQESEIQDIKRNDTAVTITGEFYEPSTPDYTEGENSEYEVEIFVHPRQPDSNPI